MKATTPKQSYLPSLDAFIRSKINDKARKIHYYYRSIIKEYEEKIEKLTACLLESESRHRIVSDPELQSAVKPHLKVDSKSKPAVDIQVESETEYGFVGPESVEEEMSGSESGGDRISVYDTELGDGRVSVENPEAAYRELQLPEWKIQQLLKQFPEVRVVRPINVPDPVDLANDIKPKNFEHPEPRDINPALNDNEPVVEENKKLKKMIAQKSAPQLPVAAKKRRKKRRY